jgi:hypothetical protein
VRSDEPYRPTLASDPDVPSPHSAFNGPVNTGTEISVGVVQIPVGEGVRVRCVRWAMMIEEREDISLSLLLPLIDHSVSIRRMRTAVRSTPPAALKRGKRENSNE